MDNQRSSGLNFVQNGELLLFNHFQDDGEMWRETGSRTLTKIVEFDNIFENPPVVHLSIIMMDSSAESNLRYELFAKNIERKRFEIIFKTWLDTRIASIIVSWTALGMRDDNEYWNDI